VSGQGLRPPLGANQGATVENGGNGKNSNGNGNSGKGGQSGSVKDDNKEIKRVRVVGRVLRGREIFQLFVLKASRMKFIQL
jgi:hypothetical protein